MDAAARPGHSLFEDAQGLVTDTLLVTLGVAFLQHLGLATRRVAGFALLVSLWTGVFFGSRVRTVRSRAIALKCQGKPSGVNGTSKLR